MIIQGDALSKLKELSEKSVNMCMTSPPYWALRDYGVEGQLGLEPTFDQYISNLCDIFDEVKRVLRDDGTCWVNMGDTYASSPAGNKEIKHDGDGVYGRLMERHTQGGTSEVTQKPKDYGIVQNKSLTCIPFRFALEMINRGWILRNTIIWHKPNCMPSSAKDRFTVDFEYLFFFSKKKKYYFEEQLEPHKSNWRDQERMRISRDEGRIEYSGKWKGNKDAEKFGSPRARTQRPNQKAFVAGNEKGRNKRTVWRICPQPFKEAHFAVYPEELCETPIKAGCPELFKCEICNGYGKVYKDDMKEFSCKDCCGKGVKVGVVLDPFFGAGTTGLVALKQGKKFIGIELSPEYIKIAEKRLKPFIEQVKLSELSKND